MTTYLLREKSMLAETDMSAVRSSRAKLDRSVVISPVLNLAPARPTGATLKHRRPILQLRGSGISGTAMLSLTPDHKTLDVRVSLYRPRAIDIRLRRLPRNAQWNNGRAGEDDLLIVEIVALEPSAGDSRDERRFSLGDRRVFNTFAYAQDLLRTGVRPWEFRAESVAGVHVEPAREVGVLEQASPPYFTERMLAEIAAAELSQTAIAASRHVELAILYAHQLRGAGAGLR